MMEARGRRSCREMSPDRAKVCVQPRIIRPTFRKVQVVYYLSRNGQLEHPHYMEVAHLDNHQLRLKDVLDRLTILRGKGMPSLYSWSCKRSYKNGYVWNDLAENDVIYPSEGAEYVLKGSELIEGCTENIQQLHGGNVQQFQQLRGGNVQQFQQLHLGNVQQAQDSRNIHSKSKTIALKRHPQPEEVDNNNNYEEEDEENEEEVVEEEEEEYEEKTSYTTSTTPHSRCSRGVSTDELEQQQHQQIVTHKNPSSEVTQHNSSPPSTTTSSTLSDKANDINNTSKRFEDGDPVATDSLLSRNSVLFQLISCGGTMPFRGTKNVSIVKQQPPPPPTPSTAARKSSSGNNLHKGVLCKAAAAKVVVEEEDEIICMSENPRFGNLHIEEKEYFSGSIVESMATEERVQMEPALKKSSSYNAERSSKAGLGEAAEEEVKREKSVKAKCIPRKKSSSKQSDK